MSANTVDQGDLTIPIVDPKDILPYAESLQSTRLYEALHALWDAAVDENLSSADASFEVHRAQLYIKTAEIRGAQQLRHLVELSQRQFAGNQHQERLRLLATDFDQVRLASQSLWSAHDHLLAVGRSLADLALGTAFVAAKIGTASPIAQLDHTLQWLFDHSTHLDATWSQHAREIALNRFEWLNGHDVALTLQREGPHTSVWRLTYRRWEDQPEA